MSNERPESEQEPMQHMDQRGMYIRFGLMLATSLLVMFAISYTNVYALEHIRFSEERLYMAVTMVAAMAIVMLGYMWGSMYRSTAVNVGIVVAAVALGFGAFGLSQSQVLVDDESYMEGMIPHHSIAILTSERAGIEDVRVRELADEIVEAQRREIAEMEWLLADIEENGEATTAADAEARPVPSFPASP